jgi:inner membrane protein
MIVRNSEDIRFNLIVAAAIILGALINDIDHPSSFLGRYVFFLNVGSQHRNAWTHSPVAVIVLALPILVYSKVFYIAFVLSSIGHIILDLLTPMGVPLLAPFRKDRYSWGKLEAKILEPFIAMFCLAYLFGVF